MCRGKHGTYSDLPSGILSLPSGLEAAEAAAVALSGSPASSPSARRAPPPRCRPAATRKRRVKVKPDRGHGDYSQLMRVSPRYLQKPSN